MNKNVVTAKPNVTIKEASNVMSTLHIGSLVIVEDDKLIGIITGSDILKSVAEGRDPDKTYVSDIMSKNVITIESEKKVEDAVRLMMENKIKKLPVVDDKKLVGIITASDIMVVEPKLIESIANLVSIKLPGYRGG